MRSRSTTRWAARLAAGVVTAALGMAAVLVSAMPAAAAGPRPLFQLPFACGDEWVAFTRSDHSPNPNSLDMTRLAGNTNNQAILASYGGRVAAAGWDDGGGWFVRIDHGGGWQTRYLHMIASPEVSVGQQVSQRQRIGRVGSTGNSSGPHLHYEQIADGTTVRSWFNGSPVTVEVGQAQNLTSHNCGAGGGGGSVDGDGFDDIVSVYTSGELMWYRNSGSNTFSGARSLGNAPGFRLMSMGDVNGDGFADIVAVYTSGDLVWYQNSGSNTFSAARSLGSAPGFRLMSMGDVNGDGFADIVAVYTSGDLVWYQNSGSNTFSAARSLGSAPGFRLMAMGDVNGDGNDDIVAVYTGGELMWYQNSGSNTFSGARSLGNAPAFRLMSMGDVNGDGFDDIVSVYTSGDLAWYQNSRSNTFSSARSLGNAPGFRLMST